VRGVTVRALRMLMEYPWPGNVRELANEVRRAVYLCPENGNIESSTLSKSLRSQEDRTEVGVDDKPTDGIDEALRQAPRQEMPSPAGLGFDSLDLAQLEGQAVTEALRRCQGNQVRAARLLGISRQSLRRRMERLGLL
jgi:DNA-binding NtrC family response regulator